MENERKNNTLITIIITLLVVAVIGLVSFIVYDKVINKEKGKNLKKLMGNKLIYN